MFLSNISRKERIGIAVATVIVSIAIIDRLIINPINKRIQQINNDIKVNERQLIVSLHNLSQREIVASQYAKFSKYLTNAGSEEEVVTAMLSVIGDIGKNSALNILDLKPQETKERGFYKEYTIDMEAEGTMESIINFMYQLNASSQLLRVEKLHLSIKDKDSPIIKASILITKIVFS